MAANIVSLSMFSKLPLAALVAIAHPAGQRLVGAVFAPGLGDRFQLDIGRIAVQLAEMPLDRLHFRQRQVQLARTAQLLERGIIQFANRYADQLKLVGLAHIQPAEIEWTDHDLFNRVVGQYFAAQRSKLNRFEGGQPDLLQGPHAADANVEIGDRVLSARMPRDP